MLHALSSVNAEELIKIVTIFHNITCYYKHVKSNTEIYFVRVTLSNLNQKIQDIKIKTLSFEVFKAIPI
jgi:hypothetical protein